MYSQTLKLFSFERLKFLITIFLLFFATIVYGQNNGKISGVVVDGEFGEGLIGANVMIEGTMMGGATDINGKYTISGIPAGEYSVRFSMIGYSKSVVTGVVVEAGEVTKLDIVLETETFETDEVVITAKAATDTEAALLVKRQKSNSISDAISAEDISRSGSGDAAAAMAKVTGASTVDGKYVYIRGLGERYSSTQLNGAEIPSADPDKRTVQMDLFPSNLLENIVTTKTFTPDKPGNYTGGSVNLATKSFPEKLTLNFSASSSYNSNTTGNDAFLSYGNGSDWLAMDKDSRELPDILSDSDFHLPDPGSARTDSSVAMQLHDATRSFDPTMAPKPKSAPVNQSYSLSYGNQFLLGERPLGVLASLTYSKKYNFYDQGQTGIWILGGNVDQFDELNNHQLLNDSKGVEEVLWGGIFNVSYKLLNNHEIKFNFMYNQGSEDQARYQIGSFPRDLNDNNLFETRVLKYTERNLSSYQLKGNHLFTDLFDLNVKWNASISQNKQDEPDLRFFSNTVTLREIGDRVDTLYSIDQNLYPAPSRYFRNLNEDNFNYNMDLSLPFKQWSGLASKLKFGWSFLEIEREFREKRYQYTSGGSYYSGDAENFFNSDNIGLNWDRSNNGYYRFGYYLQDFSTPTNNYDGYQAVNAGYLMVDLPISHKFRVITGARYEYTKIDVASLNTELEKGGFVEHDILPSLNLLYNVTDNMNLRAAYGKTLARPTFRELATYPNFEFVGGFIFLGNPNLKRTLVDNYDLRWEWFVRPGEIYAISGFYKDFKNPIEKVIQNTNNEVQFKNVEKAVVYGVEFELRKRLDQIADFLNNFQIGSNLTFVDSKVDISKNELEIIRQFDADADSERELAGQSPFIFNIDLAYQNYESGTSISLFYNIFGDRLSEISMPGTPNVYERSRGILDLTMTQLLFDGLKLKLSAKNLLDSDIKKTHKFKGKEYIRYSYKKGVDLSVGLSWNIN